jgi:parvulin-like peptidyl-prolyl isomerase
MKKLLKEPLVHFLLIGLGLFFIYGLVNTKPDQNEIIIDDGLINEIAAKWELQRNRQPTLEELSGLVNEFVEQEVLYQEALAMNLDHNDEIVKRRLAQKMEFISDGLAESLQPTEDMLIKYFEANKDNYSKDPVYTMSHIYFSQDKRDDAYNDAQSALNSVSKEGLGDPISLPKTYTDASAFAISRDYGTSFAKSLDTLEIGKWSGPINSGLGVHLVFIKEKKAGGLYTFEAVKDKVIVDYNFEASNDFKKELITTLLKGYKISIDIESKNLKKVLDEKY